MEAAKDAANAVRNTVYSVAQKGDAKRHSEEVAEKELDKTGNVKTAAWDPNVTEESGAQPMKQAKSLVDNLGKLGPVKAQQ